MIWLIVAHNGLIRFAIEKKGWQNAMSIMHMQVLPE